MRTRVKVRAMSRSRVVSEPVSLDRSKTRSHSIQPVRGSHLGSLHGHALSGVEAEILLVAVVPGLMAAKVKRVPAKVTPASGEQSGSDGPLRTSDLRFRFT